MNRFFLLFALVMGIIMSGCSNVVEVKTQRLRPAKYNLAGTNIIVIYPIKDSSAQRGWQASNPEDIANELVEELKNAKMPGSDEAIFKVHSPDDIKNALKEQDVQASDAYALEHQAKLGELLGADAILEGEITTLDIKIHPVREQNLKEQTGAEESSGFSKLGMDLADSQLKQTKVTQTFVRKGEADITVNYKITNVETGERLLSENMSVKAVIEKTAGTSDTVSEIKVQTLYNEAIKKIATEFRAAIAPHQEDVTVELEKIEHPDWGRALNFAKSGRWDSAAPVFQKMAKEASDPAQKASANYGWGVSLHYNNRFKNAKKVLEAAMQGNPSPRYQGQLDAVDQTIKDLEKVKEQVEDKETADEEAEM